MKHIHGGIGLGIGMVLLVSQVWAGDMLPTTAEPPLDPGEGFILMQAQEKAKPTQPSPAPAKPTPPPTTPTPPAPTPPTPPPTDLTTAAGAQTPPGRTDVSALARATSLTMLGDQGSIGIPGISFGPRGLPGFPPVPGAVKGAALLPAIRGFKISEEESPRPLDRVYFGFNYYNRVNEDVNERFGSDVQNINVYREIFGIEKTFLDGDASIGLRLPLNTLETHSAIPGLAETSTDVGDLSIILKYAFYQDKETNDLASIGVGVTVPTGPDAFANSNVITSFHETTIQPFLGYIWNVSDDLYVHGFFAVDIPTNSRDVTLMYNDIGMGYYLYRDRESDACLSAIVPIFEIHVNTPLNHRGAFDFNDLAGTPDVVNLTFGTHFEFNQRARLTLGVVTPITGPQPFDFEALAHFNYVFGASGSRCSNNWTATSNSGCW